MDAFITRKRHRSDDVGKATTRQNTSISPPPKRKCVKESKANVAEKIDLTGLEEEDVWLQSTDSKAKVILRKIIPSPIQLNHIRDLPAASNIDTLKLSDILSDPLIKECWLFNYLFDIDFVM